MAAASCAQAQTDDAAPFYTGVSAGVTHVSNIYRVSGTTALPEGTTNSDNVTTVALLAGLNTRLGRQRLSFDGSLQDNRYASNSALNNSAYSLRTALDWETVGDLSGTLSAQASRSLAQFNLGNGAELVTQKNLERSREVNAVARLGAKARYSLEAGVSHRSRDFSAEQYDRFVYSQNTATVGAYARPGGDLRLGLVARHTKGDYPRYPIFLGVFRIGSLPIDFRRDDLDLTATWSTGGSSQLYTRISKSRGRYDPASVLRDYNSTTGAINWTWQPTAKLNLGVQLVRDTGQETLISTTDVNRIYNSWQLSGGYALTAKVSLNATAAGNRNHRDDGGFDSERTQGIGLRWAYSRGLSLACQYNHASRDSSVLQYVYTANSYGCTGQALFF
ncbi:MAG: outer membrane beta-barrel protein [Methylotenera sp.]|jgi:hypothetical protein|nr:outer membrane beta-barrel protein [Methylotenera sp.]